MQKPGGNTEGQNPSEDTLDKSDFDSQVDDSSMNNDYLKLRKLLLGDDYSEAIQSYISKEQDVERIVEDLPKALKESSQDDLSETLAPVIDQALGKSIEQNPARITNIIFPIMGPAVRKAVSAALAEMVQSLNTLLEQSLSFGSLKWRVKAWRAGMPYAKYVLLQTIQFRVEQVLLVHRETGILLNSVTAPEIEAQDPELVSSMLTAISDFVSDSFSGGKETLEKVRFGDLELQLYVGPKAVLAIAVRGSASDEVFEKAHTVIEQIHSMFVEDLNHFDGDRASFKATDPILSECLLSQKVEGHNKRKPWLALMLIVSLVSYFIYESVISFQLDQQFRQMEDAVNNLAGYVVISSHREGKQLVVKALRSPESLPVNEVGRSLSDQIGLNLMIQTEIIHFGPLPEPKVLEPKVKQKSPSELIRTQINKLQNTIFYFDPGEVSLSKDELLKIPGLLKDLSELEQLLGEDNFKNIQLILMGFADGSGSTSINNKVSKQRADEIKSLLHANDVNSDIIVTWGVGHIDRDGFVESLQRRVTLQVLLPDSKNSLAREETLEQINQSDTTKQIEYRGEQL